MNFCKNFTTPTAKAVPCQGECMAYPCCEWPEIMEMELNGTYLLHRAACLPLARPPAI